MLLQGHRHGQPREFPAKGCGTTNKALEQTPPVLPRGGHHNPTVATAPYGHVLGTGGEEGRDWLGSSADRFTTAMGRHGQGGQRSPGVHRGQAGVLTLCSALGKPHLELLCPLLGSPGQETGNNWRESKGVQDAEGLEPLCDEERLRNWGLFSLETRLRGGLINAYQYLKGGGGGVLSMGWG